ncbi:MAG: hypothetical protein H7196_02600 [candidate division SR1 bacterium]|nr:hypothetical protein [candidate division SR1 bacterium]
MILNKYIYRLLVGLLCIAAVTLAIYAFMVFGLQSQNVSLPNIINNKAPNPYISFDKTHKISINGTQKAIWKSYQFKSSDFTEGQNIISIERQSIFGIHGFSKNYTVFVDRVAPELKLIANIPQEVINQNSIDIYLQQEIGTTIYYNDVKADFKDKKLSVNLKSGLNRSKLSVVDRYQNSSKVFDFSVNNLNQTKYKLSKCDKFSYTLDTTQQQIGYSGVEGKSEITNESDIYFGDINLAKCDSSEIKVPIYPLGYKANCWNCDKTDTYINITNTQKTVNRPTLENQLKYPNISKAEEYTGKSGIKGDLLKKINLSEKTVDGKTVSILQVFLTYDFLIGEKQYQVSGSVNINDPKMTNFEQDFMFVIDHIYLADPSDPHENFHSDLKLPGLFKIEEFNGLEFKYQPDWKVTYQLKKDNGLLKGSKLKAQNNIVVLEKGGYSVTILQSLKDQLGVCNNPIDLEKVKTNYNEKFIDGIKLLVPLVTKIKTQPSGSVFNKALVVNQNQYGASTVNCIFTAGVYDYSITINIYDDSKPVISFDEEIEGEIINMISSIKWF